MATTVALNAIQTHFSQLIGVDQDYVFTEVDGDDMTGRSMSFMLKRRPTDDDADALLTLTTGTGAITIAGDVVTVHVTDEDTDEIDPGTAFWELKRMDGGAETVTGYGQFRLIRGVHHA